MVVEGLLLVTERFRVYFGTRKVFGKEKKKTKKNDFLIFVSP